MERYVTKCSSKWLVLVGIDRAFCVLAKEGHTINGCTCVGELSEVYPDLTGFGDAVGLTELRVKDLAREVWGWEEESYREAS